MGSPSLHRSFDFILFLVALVIIASASGFPKTRARPLGSGSLRDQRSLHPDGDGLNSSPNLFPPARSALEVEATSGVSSSDETSDVSGSKDQITPPEAKPKGWRSRWARKRPLPTNKEAFIFFGSLTIIIPIVVYYYREYLKREGMVSLLDGPLQVLPSKRLS